LPLKEQVSFQLKYKISGVQCESKIFWWLSLSTPVSFCRTVFLTYSCAFALYTNATTCIWPSFSIKITGLPSHVLQLQPCNWINKRTTDSLIQPTTPLPPPTHV
jgi:hypothetical protein